MSLFWYIFWWHFEIWNLMVHWKLTNFRQFSLLSWNQFLTRFKCIRVLSLLEPQEQRSAICSSWWSSWSFGFAWFVIFHFSKYCVQNGVVWVIEELFTQERAPLHNKHSHCCCCWRCCCCCWCYCCFLEKFHRCGKSKVNRQKFLFLGFIFNPNNDWRRCCCCCCLAIIFWSNEKKCQNERDDDDEGHNVNHFECLLFHCFTLRWEKQKLWRKNLFFFLLQPQVSHKSSLSSFALS